MFTQWNFTKDILMVTPNGFKVSYGINPHMFDHSGKLNQVDEKMAHNQWSELKSKLESLGANVLILEGQTQYPDMVFCANQFFTFPKENNRAGAILSHMNNKERKGEVQFIKNWLVKNNYEIYQLKNEGTFEGMGDAIWDYQRGLIFGGHGFRTRLDVYDEIKEITEFEIIPLKLVDERFYHLDTCFAIIDRSNVAIVREAFEENDRKLISRYFENVIEIDLDEAIISFGGNLFSLNGKDVILQKGAKKLTQELIKRDFRVHEVNTSEFIKAGGSVFCMKHQLWLPR